MNDEINPCERCGIDTGHRHFSDPRCNATGLGVVLCVGCADYLADQHDEDFRAALTPVRCGVCNEVMGMEGDGTDPAFPCAVCDYTPAGIFWAAAWRERCPCGARLGGSWDVECLRALREGRLPKSWPERCACGWSPVPLCLLAVRMAYLDVEALVEGLRWLHDPDEDPDFWIGELRAAARARFTAEQVEDLRGRAP